MSPGFLHCPSTIFKEELESRDGNEHDGKERKEWLESVGACAYVCMRCDWTSRGGLVLGGYL